MRHLIFDLDGTLLDSERGIVGAFAAVMDHFSLPYGSKDEFRCVVGPPLYECFPRFGIPADREKEALAVFQEYYAKKGVYENCLFEGVRDALFALKDMGSHLYIATGKPERFAEMILARLGIRTLFDAVMGADMEEKNVEKPYLLGELFKRAGITPASDIAMIGDRSYDIVGGKAHGLYTVGVLWGIGKEDELLSAKADRLLSHPSELVGLTSL